jgi:hypothetical protein
MSEMIIETHGFHRVNVQKNKTRLFLRCGAASSPWVPRFRERRMSHRWSGLGFLSPFPAQPQIRTVPIYFCPPFPNVSMQDLTPLPVVSLLMSNFNAVFQDVTE